MSPQQRVELVRLLSAYCDNAVSEAASARLQELLAADAEARREYLRYMDMHGRLLVHPRFGLPALEESRQPEGPPRQRSPRPRVFRAAIRYALVAATAAAAAVLTQAIWWPRSEANRPINARLTDAKPAAMPKYVATLTDAFRCTWEADAEARFPGARLLPGDLTLRQGLAHIHFDGGPDLVIEGPAALHIQSESAATLLHGKVVFKADETVAPFDLRTPSSKLVDLGTEYAVVVGPQGDEIHVFDGEVLRSPRGAPSGESEHLKAGQARRYDGSASALGTPTPLNRDQFAQAFGDLRKPKENPRAGLLAYEGFAYADSSALAKGHANGGFGWASAWRPGFARPIDDGDRTLRPLNVQESLSRPRAATASIGGSFDYAGFAKYFRRLASPIRLDIDGVYYLSFLFRRMGPQGDPTNAVGVLLRTSSELEQELGKRTPDSRQRLNIGIGGPNELFTHLQGVGSRTPLPLRYGDTYLMVAKIVAGKTNPGQVFMRVFGPDDVIEAQEPGSWSVVGPTFHSDLSFDWLEIHINSKTRQTLDELRLGTTWASVTAPYTPAKAAAP